MTESRHFGVFFDGGGCSMVEYRRERDGIRILSTAALRRTLDNEELAAKATVDLMRGLAPAGSSLVVVAHGLGTVAHTMTLPPASDDVLRPIVQREIQRVFATEDPVVGFLRGAAVERRGAPREPNANQRSNAPQQILIVAAPRALVSVLQQRLMAEGVGLELITVAAHALQRLFVSADGSLEPTAVLGLLRGRPHLSFFIGAKLAVAVDPPVGTLEELPALDNMVMDQLERGIFYFRRQFRNVSPARVVLVCSIEDFRRLAPQIEEKFSLPVSQLAPATGTAEAAVIVGAALEAEQSQPLSLLERPPTKWAMLRRRFAPASAIVTLAAGIAIAAATISIIQFARFERSQRALGTTQTQVAGRLASLGTILNTAQHRDALTHEIVLLTDTRRDRDRVAALLGAMATATPPGIRFDSLSLMRKGDNWQGRIQAEATAVSAAAAVRLVDEFYRGLPAAVSMQAPVLEQLDYVASKPGESSRGVSVIFRITFLAETQPPHAP